MSARQSRRDAIRAAREQDEINKRIRLREVGGIWLWSIDNMHGRAPTRHEAMRAANYERRAVTEWMHRMTNAAGNASRSCRGMAREFRRGVYAVDAFVEAMEP